MATPNDRLAVYAQLEHLQSKHVGTGHPDITKQRVVVFSALYADLGRAPLPPPRRHCLPAPPTPRAATGPSTCKGTRWLATSVTLARWLTSQRRRTSRQGAPATSSSSEW